MLTLPHGVRIYLARGPTDMRKAIDGLAALTKSFLKRDPCSGHLFVFCNRRSDRVKILYWDRDGWAIWYKRLEAGTFQFPFSETGRKEVAAWELAVLLEGIDLKKGKRRKRYRLPGGVSNKHPEGCKATPLPVGGR